MRFLRFLRLDRSFSDFELSSRKAEGLALRSLGNLHSRMSGAKSIPEGFPGKMMYAYLLISYLS